MRAPSGVHDLVLASNWLPVTGAPPAWTTPAGSASAALRTIARDRGAAWVGCQAGGSGRPQRLDRVWLQPVPLFPGQVADYYHGHCLGSLAPLYLDGGQQPQYRPQWRSAYCDVNARVALAAARLAAAGAAVWVNDYHLQLVPGELREHRPDLQVGMFLHAPFPPVERFLRQPMRNQVLSGLLGADVIGFSHARSAANFLDVAAELGGHRHDGQTLHVAGRHVTTRVLPTPVDTTSIQRLATDITVRQQAAQMRAALGEPSLVVLSIGSPDPVDGVGRRLDAYAQLLDEGRLDPHRTVLIHVAASGDEQNMDPLADHDRIDRQVGQINGVYARLGRPVVHYLRRELPPAELVAVYLAADLLIATPLHHGPVLAAKEFVAARVADTGRLVVSEYTGAAADLPEAHLVNPHDIEAAKTAILLSASQARTPNPQMAAMRQRLELRGVQVWADTFLTALSTVARRERSSSLAGAEQ